MSDDIINFANPPVIERVLGVQFEPVGLTSGHLGWFWKSRLGEEWTTVDDAPPLQDQFESFGKRISLPQFRFEQRSSVPANRLRIRANDGSRLMQIQDTRFVFNWVRHGEGYPRFRELLAEFEHQLAAFCSFAQDAALTPIKPNQWEVTYVNKIPAGELWGEPSDWPDVIPGLLPKVGNYGGTRFERMSGEWTSEIPDKQGRLHIDVQYQAGAENKNLAMNLTARGSIAAVDSLAGKLMLGHDTIVRAFDEITSDTAHIAWRRE